MSESNHPALHSRDVFLLTTLVAETMKVKVTKRGVTVPKRMLHGAREVTIREEKGHIIIEPVGTSKPEDPDPIRELGREPVPCNAPDAAEHHDRYLYGK